MAFELMAENRTSQTSALRRAIDCLPSRTREAMLVGIANNTIVVGAYTYADGICPMLAAHRNGGRTDFVAFARSWDEYCFRGVRPRKRRPRLASASELATLRAYIESSMLADESVRPPHRDPTLAHGDTPEPEDREPVLSPVAPDSSSEQPSRAGWRELAITRSLDEFELALTELAAPAEDEYEYEPMENETGTEAELAELHG
jgi:hypothetical protein